MNWLENFQWQFKVRYFSLENLISRNTDTCNKRQLSLEKQLLRYLKYFRV